MWEKDIELILYTYEAMSEGFIGFDVNQVDYEAACSVLK